MTTATEEKVRPTENEIRGVTVVPELNKKAWQDINDTLKDVGVPEHEPGLGVAPPIEQPVLSAPLAKSVGAENVGAEEFNFNEEVQSKHRDVRSLLKGVVKSVVGGSHKVRHAPGYLFAKLRKGKISQSAKLENKHDPRQLEIE